MSERENNEKGTVQFGLLLASNQKQSNERKMWMKIDCK